MFEINYKMFRNDEIEDTDLRGEYGYFQFNIDEESYGLIIPEEITDFSVSVYE